MKKRKREEKVEMASGATRVRIIDRGGGVEGR